MKEIKIKGLSFIKIDFDAGSYMFDGYSITLPLYEKKGIKGVVYDFFGNAVSVIDSGISFMAKDIKITAKQCFNCSIKFRDVYKNSYSETYRDVNYIKIDYQNQLVLVDDGKVVIKSSKQNANSGERIEELKRAKLELEIEKKKNVELTNEKTKLNNELEFLKKEKVNNVQKEISSLKSQLANEKTVNEKLTIENNNLKRQTTLNLGNFLDEFKNLIKHLKKENKQLCNEFENQKREYDYLIKQEKEITTNIETLSSKKSEVERKISKSSEKLACLKDELKSSESQKDILDLDCEKASYEINGIKERLQLDEETISLLEDNIVLKKGTISNALVELDSEIENIEKRVALILKLRQRFNQNVTEAIITGNGDLSSELEEGAFDGD